MRGFAQYTVKTNTPLGTNLPPVVGGRFGTRGCVWASLEGVAKAARFVAGEARPGGRHGAELCFLAGTGPKQRKREENLLLGQSTEDYRR